VYYVISLCVYGGGKGDLRVAAFITYELTQTKVSDSKNNLFERRRSYVEFQIYYQCIYFMCLQIRSRSQNESTCKSESKNR